MFAGIVRHDGHPIAKDWTDRLTRAVGAPAMDWSSATVSAALFSNTSHARSAHDRDHALVLSSARLDNTDDLLTQLGDRHTGETDAEIVARSYHCWGESCVEKFVGEFALAAWHPAHGRLFLSGDPLGIRPLYYFAGDGLFVFASALPLLLALPCVPRTLNDDSIAHVLCGDGTWPSDATFYQAIKQLPAGRWVTLEQGVLAGGVHPAPWAAPKTGVPRHERDAARDLRDLIVQAVECRMRGADRVAVHLSGGLDSSAIACIAARHLKRDGRRLVVLCSVLPPGSVGPEVDERPFIDAVLAQEDNIDVEWVEAPADLNPFAALPRWFDCLGEPPFSNATHIEERLGEAGRALGVDVVLSGFGGDFFASAPGQGALAEIFASGRWRGGFSELRAMGRIREVGWLRLLLTQVVRPLVLRRFPTVARRASWFAATPDLVRRTDARRGRPLRATTMPGAYAHEMMRFVLAPGHIQRPLAALSQVFAREFRQDLRFPLFDTRIIAFMLGTAPEQLQQDGVSRSLMRRAMVGILPESIRMRPDKGPAFDPALASHCTKARQAWRQWALDTADDRCWTYVDRNRFLNALSATEPAGRAAWRPDMFTTVLTGGRIAKFVEWHDRAGDHGW